MGLVMGENAGTLAVRACEAHAKIVARYNREYRARLWDTNRVLAGQAEAAYDSAVAACHAAGMDRAETHTMIYAAMDAAEARTCRGCDKPCSTDYCDTCTRAGLDDWYEWDRRRRGVQAVGPYVYTIEI